MRKGSTSMSQRARRGCARSLSALVALLFCGCAVDARRVPERPARVDGRPLYLRTCATCHGADGQGTPPAYPPLAGHLPRLLAMEGGRQHLLRVLLFGLAGPLIVEGEAYDGVMAPADFYDDEQLAAILNHVTTAWGNARMLPAGHAPITAGEIAALRTAGFDPWRVQQLRPREATPGAAREK